MEHELKDYFGKSFGYNEKDKQDFDSSMQNVADFLTTGLFNYKKQNNMDITEEVEKFRKNAKDAYTYRRMNEADTYFQKILELNSDDYEAIFYHGICSVFDFTSSNSQMKNAVLAYDKAICQIPTNLDWNEITVKFTLELADLIVAWYKTSHEIFQSLAGDWYYYNIDKFYKHTELCAECISYMDRLMPIILQSEISEYNKEEKYAYWYCRMCEDYCCETMYYKIDNRDQAITSSRYAGALGYSLAKKRDVVEKYDNMCFEIRKFNPRFEMIENEWDSGFDRQDPPTTYQEQQIKNQQRRRLQLMKEREISQKIAAWRSSGGREKDERKKRFLRYMSTHDEERKQYQELQKEYKLQEKDFKNIWDELQEIERITDENKKKLDFLKKEISEVETKILKLEKKILGKKKAQEEIQLLKQQNNQREAEVDILIKELEKNEKEKMDGSEKISKKKVLLQSAERDVDMFISNCLI